MNSLAQLAILTGVPRNLHSFMLPSYVMLKNNYARYFPEEYQQPIFQPRVLEVLEKDKQLQTVKYKPFLPATISKNSSVFYDARIEKFTNMIMKGGDKWLARQLIEKTFYNIKKIQYKRYREANTKEEKEKIVLNPLTVFHMAIENCIPLLNVTQIKKGAIVYQVPVPLSETKALWLSMKWLIEAGRDKGNDVHLPIKLSKELLDAASYEGIVIKKKQDLHKLCEANRAYAHFRWS